MRLLLLPWTLSILVALGAFGAQGCGTEETPTGGKGSFGGRVIVSGPLRGATVSIDQLDAETGAVRAHVADAMTDDDGHFSADVGLANGLLRATASGGSFVDLVSGATIQLDPTDKLTSLVVFELDDMRDDILVSPVGHLADARAAWKLAELGDVNKAVEAATEHLHRHFGNVDWSTVQIVGLDQPATSPTEPVRAALVQAALSVLANDIASAAESSPQDVNVYTLTQRWADDIGSGVFDGNDDNDRAPGTGLQLGACNPVPVPCDLPSGCSIGACRTLCDLYAGSPRALLAGAMTKVIQDNDPDNPSALNKTQLDLSDTLAIARSINDNLDDDLFGGACIEQLDRLPPTIMFLPPSPADGSYAGGTIAVKVSAIDDTDASPRATVLGFPDADGDPQNSIAIAMIDTTAMPDGETILQAAAVDISGNMAKVTRTLQVDNTLPELTLDSTGFLVDGATWWTSTATPTLKGTVSDAAPVTVKAVINGVDVPGSVTGTDWTLLVPASALDLAGTEVTIVATDAAGNHTEIIQRIRPDLTAPELSFQTSNVNDEAGDQISFATDESPTHTHGGTPIDLSVSNTCAAITKFNYLLGPSSPTFVTELPDRNPIAYQLVVSDDGVGIVAASTQYRVLRHEMGGGTSVVLGWTSTGAGTSIGAGVRLFGVPIQSDLVAELAIKEATYDVEFRATDRLARTSTTSRCFELHLRAPPLHFTTSGPAVDHTYALNTLSLAPGAPYDSIAARLLKDTATGASLLDQFVTNGTTETVYLTVTVTKPTSVTARQAFTIRNYSSASSANINCDTNLTACQAPDPFPSGGGYVSQTNTTTATTLLFPAKVYELDAAGMPSTQVACLAPCSPSGNTFTFAIPPRAANGAARKFVVMTMIGQVTNLWPSDGNHPATEPFSDSVINGVDYTGKLQFTSTGCTRAVLLNNVPYCRERTTRKQYRALTYAALSFEGDTKSSYAIAPTSEIAPAPVAAGFRSEGNNWGTNEGPLP